MITSPVSLKVLTYNLHKGFRPWRWLQRFRSNPHYAIDQMREAIRASGADLVFLQEVGVRESQKFTENQMEYLADQIWPHFAYGKNALYAEDTFDGPISRHHGNAILSKYPIIFSENIDISQNPLEKRGVLHCKIDIPSQGTIDLVCTHLNLLEMDRKKQLELLSQRVQTHTATHSPLIVAGDFNDWRRNATPILKSALALHEVAEPPGFRTFPAIFPVLHLDRIYYRNLELVDAHVTRREEWGDLSDHLGVIANFLYKEPTRAPASV